MQIAAEGARKRAALETYARHEATLRRTASRYSLCEDDADEALQRALEILLTKAPSEDPRELIRWTQTVVKHEALAVRRDRERILSGPAARAPEPGRDDWVALLPSEADGPPERAERREAIARSREALQALKPQELRALSLLAEGYSYAEIGEITGFSHTKINRCLAEGRERFRKVLARSEDGSRCEEIVPLLSAFCDGEAKPAEADTVREHLRACATCRATLRTYRAAPRAAAALAPALPLGHSLVDRIRDAWADLAGRFSGNGGAEVAVSQAAAGGGAGLAGVAKVVAICAGAAGTAACVAAGVVPTPLGAETTRDAGAPMERVAEPAVLPPETGTPSEGSAASDQAVRAKPKPDREKAAAAPPVPEPVPSGEAVEPAPEPAPEPVAAPEPSYEGSSAPAPASDPAGEFGP